VRFGHHPRRQGDLGEISALEWLASVGAAVFVPVGHSPDIDLVAELDGRLVRVQVKTCGVWRNRRWEVTLCTRGGNQSWNGVVKHFSAQRADFVFVHVADGRRWFIPAEQVGGRSCIVLGGPKYEAFEVEPGRPFPVPSGVAPLHSIPARAGFPSGQRDETVNLAAQPSQVRILPPPPLPDFRSAKDRSASR
jgi:PD-(D/E)XK nuclease superfamily protein